MLWVSFQFVSLNKQMASKTSRTKLEHHVEKLSRDTHSSLNHLVLGYNTCQIEKMVMWPSGPPINSLLLL